MKKILKRVLKTITLLIIAVNINACSTLLKLRSSPSENAFISMKTNNKDTIAYSVKSDLPDQFEQRGFIIPFNKSFRENIGNYFQIRFNNLRGIDTNEHSGFEINFHIKELNIAANYEPNWGSAILSGLADKKDSNLEIGKYSIDAKVLVNVKITRNSEIIGEKNIIVDTNYVKHVTENESYTYVETSYEQALNEAISKSIIYIDKYISSLDI